MGRVASSFLLENRRHRQDCLCALLGVLAMFSVTLLTTWHISLPHGSVAAQTMLTEQDHHDHAPEDRQDRTDPVHVAAHAVHQGAALPTGARLPAAFFAASASWSVLSDIAFASISPSSLLRPPKA